MNNNFVPVNSMDEKQLLSLVRASDVSAYTELYNRFWKDLYIHALKKTGDEDDAFDLVQELFIEFWDKRESITEVTGSLKNYLHGTVFFKLAKYFRNKGFQDKHRKNFEEFLKTDGSAAFATDTFQLRENEAQYESIIQVIHASIDEMPGKMKEIFLMSRSGNYSISEIAETLGVSTQTVKNQVSNALNKIRVSTADHVMTTAEISVLVWLTIY